MPASPLYLAQVGSSPLTSPSTAPTTTTPAVPPWTLWAVGLVGVGFLVFSIIRHSRRMARSRSADEAFMSNPQKAWAAMRAAETSALRPTHESIAGTTPLSPSPPPRPSEPSVSATPGAITQTEELRRLIIAADERIAALRRLTSTGPTASAAQAPAQAAVIEPLDDRTARVYELAAAGHEPDEIARVTGAPVSEVRLLLALRG